MKISHLGLAVPSVDGGGAIWELLGLVETHREEVASQKVITSFRPVGESSLELLEPTAPESPIAKFLEKKGPGIHHLCLEVEDVAAALASVQKLPGCGECFLIGHSAGAHLVALVTASVDINKGCAPWRGTACLDSRAYDVPAAIALSRATIRNIKENLFWAFAYNTAGIPVAAGVLHLFGGPLLNPMLAAVAMSLSSVSVM